VLVERMRNILSMIDMVTSVNPSRFDTGHNARLLAGTRMLSNRFVSSFYFRFTFIRSIFSIG
jgi:hypothetical protein